jgi:hypothetical protein
MEIWRFIVAHGEFEWAYDRRRDVWEYGWEDPLNKDWHLFFTLIGAAVPSSERIFVAILEMVHGRDLSRNSPGSEAALHQEGSTHSSQS